MVSNNAEPVHRGNQAGGTALAHASSCFAVLDCDALFPSVIHWSGDGTEGDALVILGSIQLASLANPTTDGSWMRLGVVVSKADACSLVAIVDARLSSMAILRRSWYWNRLPMGYDRIDRS